MAWMISMILRQVILWSSVFNNSSTIVCRCISSVAKMAMSIVFAYARELTSPKFFLGYQGSIILLDSSLNVA